MHSFKYLFSTIILALFIFTQLSCNKNDSSPSSPSVTAKADCVFTKHIVQTTISGMSGQPATYTAEHTTIISNEGTADANDVKIIVYVNGSSVSSLNVTGHLAAHANISDNFQTVTVGGNADCELQWN